MQTSLENDSGYVTIKVDFQIRNITRDRKEAFIVIHGPSTHQKDVLVLMLMYLITRLQNP